MLYFHKEQQRFVKHASAILCAAFELAGIRSDVDVQPYTTTTVHVVFLSSPCVLLESGALQFPRHLLGSPHRGGAHGNARACATRVRLLRKPNHPSFGCHVEGDARGTNCLPSEDCVEFRKQPENIVVCYWLGGISSPSECVFLITQLCISDPVPCPAGVRASRPDQSAGRAHTDKVEEGGFQVLLEHCRQPCNC